MRSMIDLGVALAERVAAENWIEVLKAGEWSHEAYGAVKVTVADLHKFAENFRARVRGIDLAVDVSHEPAKGAVGWFRELRVEGDTLRARVAWTEEGADLIRTGKFRYFSPEFAFQWVNATGQKFADVLLGGALTNRPFLKDLAPIALSEDAAYALLFGDQGDRGRKADPDADGDDDATDPADEELEMAEDERSAEMAEWSTAEANDLPDSAFAHIEAGGKKDAEGKTTPRSLRHLPYKDAEGKVDAPHVRNALARLNQTQIPDAAKRKARGRLVTAARKVGIKVAKMAEPRDGVGDTGRKPDDRDAGRYSEPKGGIGMSSPSGNAGGTGTLPGGAGGSQGQGATVISLAEHQAALTRIKMLEDDRRRTRFAEQVRGWIFDEKTRTGKLVPAQRDKVVDFLMTLSDDQAAKFAEIVEAGRPAIDYGERGVPHSGDAVDKETQLLKLTEELRAKNPSMDYRTAFETAAAQLQLSEV